MARFHTNPKTGEAGKCSAAAGNCPFGGDDQHYSSAEAAREAFEKTQETFTLMAKADGKSWADSVVAAEQEVYKETGFLPAGWRNVSNPRTSNYLDFRGPNKTRVTFHPTTGWLANDNEKNPYSSFDVAFIAASSDPDSPQNLQAVLAGNTATKLMARKPGPYSGKDMFETENLPIGANQYKQRAFVKLRILELPDGKWEAVLFTAQKGFGERTMKAGAPELGTIDTDFYEFKNSPVPAADIQAIRDFGQKYARKPLTADELELVSRDVRNIFSRIHQATKK